MYFTPRDIYLEKLKNFANLVIIRYFALDVIYIYICLNIFNEANIEILSKFITILTSVRNFERINGYNYKTRNGIVVTNLYKHLEFKTVSYYLKIMINLQDL